MVYEEEPEGFAPRLHAVGTFFERDGKFLVLLRQPHKANGSVWGLPAGKADEGETPIEAAVRELREETGYEADPENMHAIRTLFVRYPDYDFFFHIFRTPAPKDFLPTLSVTEHSDHRWVRPEESFELAPMPGFYECTEIAYGIKKG